MNLLSLLTLLTAPEKMVQQLFTFCQVLMTLLKKEGEKCEVSSWEYGKRSLKYKKGKKFLVRVSDESQKLAIISRVNYHLLWYNRELQLLFFEMNVQLYLKSECLCDFTKEKNTQNNFIKKRYVGSSIETAPMVLRMS